MTKIIYDTITKIFTLKKICTIFKPEKKQTTLQARLQPGGGRLYHAKKN